MTLTFGAAAVISKAISDYVYAAEPPVAIDFNATFSSRRISLSLSNAGDSDLIFSKFIVCEPNIPVASAVQSGNEDIFPRYRYSGTTYLKPGETFAPNYDFWTYHDDDEMTERVSRTNHRCALEIINRNNTYVTFYVHTMQDILGFSVEKFDPKDTDVSVWNPARDI